MKIDFHVHAFPVDIKNNRSSFFYGEPEFELLYKSSNQRIVGELEIIKMMESERIDQSVIFGFPWRKYKNFRKNNDYIIELVNKYPNYFIGFCSVDPFNLMAVNEVERCLKIGLNGVGEIAFYNRGIDRESRLKLIPIMEICEYFNVPFIIHTNEVIGHFYSGKSCNTINQIYEFIKLFPRNKIVLSHWGGGIFFYYLLKKEVYKVLSNTYYDIAASPFLYDNKIYNIAKQIVGVDKFIFGSDYPLLLPNRYLNEMSIAKLSKDDLESICYKNAVKLLNL